MCSPNDGFAIGADVGATKTILLLLGPDGEAVAREKFPSRDGDRSPLENLVLRTERLVDAAGIDPGRIVGTGVGVPSVVDAEGALLRGSPVLGAEAGENLREALTGRLPGAVRVDNDVNMAALGEHARGAAAGARDAVLITVGTNVGAGIIMDGRLRRGHRGAAGEIGMMAIDPAATAPITPYTGPLESVAGGSGMARIARDRLAEFPGTRLSAEGLTSEGLFRAAAEGDPLALAVTTDAYRHLAFAIVDILALLAPEVVVVGGGVARVGPPYLEELRRRVAAVTAQPHRIELAALGEDAGAYGAASTAQHETTPSRERETTAP